MCLFVIYISGAEIIEICDEDGRVVSDPNPMERRPPRGHMRTARILLDPAQYQLDLDALKVIHMTHRHTEGEGEGEGEKAMCISFWCVSCGV